MKNALRLTRPEPPEHAIQDAILRYLAIDRRVAWAHRFNTGARTIDDAAAAKAELLDRYAGKLYAARRSPAALMPILQALLRAYYALRKGAKRFVRFAFPGCSDILGQLRTGHFLAIEVKRPSTGPTDDQAAFLAQVNAAGGLGLVARSVDDVQTALDAFAPLQAQRAA
jgi:hypothetical protein